jgi:hypothetical protein
MAMNSTISSVGLPSASGYSVYSALKHPVYATTFIARLYAESVSGMITDQSVVPKELKEGGDFAIMRRPPTGQLFSYTKNQALEHSSMNTSNVTFKVDKAWYWSLKLDEVDVKQIPELKQWVKEYQDSCLQQLAAVQDNGVLHDMYAGAHSCNKGANAGIRTHSHNLGAVGSPLALTAASTINPLTLMVVLGAVLDEQNVPSVGRFCVWHSIVRPLFMSTPILAAAYMSGEAKSTMLTGKIPVIMDTTNIFTSHMPMYDDPLGAGRCFPVIMGMKRATGFVNQLTKTQVIDQDPNSFAAYWRGLQLTGWGVIQPELLAVAYVKVASLI